MTSAVAAVDWVARWRGLVEARHDQGRRLDRDHGRGDAWAAGRATRFNRHVRESGADDPLLQRLLAVVDGGTTVLDVGAGPGRHTLPLARIARRVVAVEPSAAMREPLEANTYGLTNVEVVPLAWPEAAERVEAADVVICAHVLYPVAEVEPFLRALGGSARRLCFLQLRLGQREGPYLELFERVWGEPRALAPTALDLLNVAHQLGFAANFEVVPFPAWRRFDSVDEAVENARQDILNPSGVDELIRAYVAPRLVEANGKLALPNETSRAGLVFWRVDG
ncbi:MAG TPA: methyltransferase domain-containing protein [Chloroflexota bacterium]|jgi:SAM-dependent methyltransferase|nr:methyltransferase domain-containing protein [Chloroflexota bacterium]